MENTRNHNHIFKRIFCIFLVFISIIILIPKHKVHAVAGFDDAIFWSILNQTFMSAAGANFVIGSNGVSANEISPISEEEFNSLFNNPLSDLRDIFFTYTGMAVEDLIEYIDWDNVFTVASGTSNIIANLPKVAVDTITLFAKGLITELGATSDSSVDWNTSNGNIASDTSCTVGEYTFVKCPSSIIIYDLMGNSHSITLTGNTDDVFIAVCYDDTNQKHMFFAFSLGSFTFADRYCEVDSSGFAFYDFYGANYYTLYGYNSDLNFPIIPRNYMGDYIRQNYNPDTSVESMDYTLVPDIDVESMDYPETAITDYPNVETIPYYTDIPYTGTIPDTGVIPYADAIPLLQDAVLSNSLEAVYEPEPPYVPDEDDNTNKPVYIPIIDIPIPTFDFSLGSIWEYVIRWVNSLGEWLGKMFTVWGYLPAPMIYPIWATAVIVIVIGVYKRFFM